jgi:hypothetical protein
VLLGSGMRGRVAIRRAVAATDVTAAEADAQVEPAVARAKAVLAALHLVGSLHPDLVGVGAAGHGDQSFSSTPAGPRLTTLVGPI